MHRVQSGWEVFKRSLKFIFQKPFLLIPMLIAWVIYIVVAVWAQGQFDFNNMETAELLLVLFGFTCLSTFTIATASLFVLELLEQHETTGKMNPFKALLDMITKDFWRALPLIIAWSIIDFVLMIVVAFLDSTRKRKNGPKRPKGFLQRSVEAFKDLVRMGSMTVFTVVAWEELGPKASFDKGFKVFKKQFAEMLTGFGLNKVIGLIMGLPIFLVVLIMNTGALPQEETMIGLIIYMSIVWSLSKLIEQLYVSELYLWYKHYELAIADAKNRGVNPPDSIYDVPKPSFTDNKFDLIKENSNVTYSPLREKTKNANNSNNEEDPFAQYDK